MRLIITAICLILQISSTAIAEQPEKCEETLDPDKIIVALSEEIRASNKAISSKVISWALPAGADTYEVRYFVAYTTHDKCHVSLPTTCYKLDEADAEAEREDEIRREAAEREQQAKEKLEKLHQKAHEDFLAKSQKVAQLPGALQEVLGEHALLMQQEQETASKVDEPEPIPEEADEPETAVDVRCGSLDSANIITYTIAPKKAPEPISAVSSAKSPTAKSAR